MSEFGIAGRQREDYPKINMDRVVELAKPNLPPGLTCYVEQTGGGCATIYVGDSYDVVGGVPVWYPPDNPCGDFRLVLAGPGSFGWGKTSYAWAEEFYVGPDQDIEEEPPDGWNFERPHPSITREQRAAEAIVKCYNTHPHIQKGGAQ